MTSENQLHQQYPDLVDEEATPERIRLIRDLDTLHAASEPPPDLVISIARALKKQGTTRYSGSSSVRGLPPIGWPSLSHRVEQRTPVRSTARRVRSTVLAVANGLAVAVVLVVIAGAFGLMLHGMADQGQAPVAGSLPVTVTSPAAGVTPTVSTRDDAFGMDPGAQQVAQNGLVTELQLVQTVDGFSVTVRQVYADANRIIIGYTVSGPVGHHFNNFQLRRPVLTDAQGTALPWRGGNGAGVQAGVGRYLDWYDATALPRAGSHDIPLRLRADSLEAIEQVGPLPTPQPRQSGAPASGTRVAQPSNETGGGSSVSILDVSGPFTFEFAVPLTPGRVAEPRQTITANGMAATLERVVVTPSETRVYLRGIKPQSAAELAVAGWNSSRDRTLVKNWTTDDGLLVYSFSASLVDRRDEWTLTIRPAANVRYGQPTLQGGTPPTSDVAAGTPWAFRFTVPPAITTGTAAATPSVVPISATPSAVGRQGRTVVRETPGPARPPTVWVFSSWSHQVVWGQCVSPTIRLASPRY
jgi:hypothetical protein